MIKDFLKNRILNHLTASKILAAVIQINDYDKRDKSEHPMLNAILKLRNSGSYSQIYCSNHDIEKYLRN
uniref:Uncharacterized protein n=1 Tax=Elaeophora elaphi TaxID=1147741 RepID=A0A0R3RHZ6_9BILA